MSINIDRRGFLKTAGKAAAISAGAGFITGCGQNRKTSAQAEVNSSETAGEMTFRTNPNSNDKVSILGYG